MAKENNLQSITLGDSTGALTQYTLVKLTGSGVSQAGAGEASFPLQDEITASGASCPIMTYGVSKVKAGASVTVGDKLMSNASGLAITATATNSVVGYALSSGSANEIIEMIVGGGGVE